METITAGQLAAWLSSHQSVSSGEQTRQMSVSQPDANGVTTYTAPDGSTISVRGTGDNLEVVDRQETQAASAPTPSLQAGQPAPPVQPTAGVGVTSQQQLEARLAAQPGLVYRGQTSKTKTTPADAFGPGQQVQVPVVTWVDPSTGHTLVAEVQPGGGSYTVIQDAVVPANKQTAAATGTSVSAPTTEPYIPIKRPDGTIDWQPNRNYVPATAPKGTVQFIKGGDGHTYAVPIDAQGNPGKPTDTGLPADAKAGSTATVKLPNGGEQIVRIDADGNAKPVYTVGGQQEILQGRGPNGEDVVVIRDDKGAVLRYEPIPGGKAPPSKTSMPSMPEIVLGHSQDALRELKDKLQQGVAAGQWTQAQADNQWKDAYETAQTTINEATVLNSKNQSELAASTNLANARLQASTSGFNNALNFIGKLNADLPAGSTLGAKAFVGLLGLQAMSAMQSGAYSGIVPGSQTLGSPSTYRSPTVAPSPAVTAAAAAAPTGGPPPPLNQGQDVSTPGVVPPVRSASSAPGPAAAAVSPSVAGAAPPPAPSVPPGRPDQTQAAPQIENAINPPAASAGGTPPLPSTPGSDPLLNVRNTHTGEIKQVHLSQINNASDKADFEVLDPNGAGVVRPAGEPAIPAASPGQSDWPPGAVSPLPPYEQSRTQAPAADFAVLRNAPPGVALNLVAPPSAYEAPADPSVLLHTQAASQLPWRMTPDQIAMYQRAGVPASVIWGVPGAAA